MEAYRKTQPHMGFVGIYLLLLPFVQVGLSFYVSVQLFIFFMLVSLLNVEDFIKNVGWAATFFVLMMSPSLFYTVDDQLHMVLGVGRQFICFFVLLAVLNRSYLMHVRIDNLEIKIVGLLSFFLFVTAIQYVGLKIGYAFNIPSGFLIANQNTMMGFEKAVELGLHAGIRPSAFYGEPSYLSFVCVSLVFIAYSSFQSNQNLLLVTLLAFAIVILANSLSGVLAIVALFSIRFMSKVKKIESIVALMIYFISVVIVAALFNQSPIMQRMLGIIGFGEGVDVSSNIRIFAPFSLLSEVFLNYPFGLPKEMLIDVINSNYEEGFRGTDNGFFNIFINFGYIGFVIVGVILYKLKNDLLLIVFVLLSSMFNGAFFSYDKIAVIGLSILIAKSLQYKGFVLREYSLKTKPNVIDNV